MFNAHFLQLYSSFEWLLMFDIFHEDEYMFESLSGHSDELFDHLFAPTTILGLEIDQRLRNGNILPHKKGISLRLAFPKCLFSEVIDIPKLGKHLEWIQTLSR